jgi:ankyrin repeat protein
LKELPKTLDETYERTLRNIDEEKWEYAYRIFQFLAVSARPLRVEELAEVFAIQVDMETTGDLNYNARWRPANAEAAVLSACSSLVTIVDVYGDQVVQYSHFSVREFLIGNRLASSQHISRYHVLPRPSHTFLAKACLTVLLHLSTRIHKKSVKKMFPLAAYAAEHWVDHARLGDVPFLIHDMEGLFDRDKPYFAAWIWAYDVNNPLGPQMVQTHPETPEATPLYYAALCGFLDLAERLIDNHPQDVDTRGGDGATPLHAALRKGHSEIALLLLRHSADANAQDNRCKTPLHIASLQGDIDAIVIQSLIDCGADPNAKDDDNETPLYLSSSNGKLEATRLLLKHGANANHQGPRGRTPLHAASINGHHHVAQLLLNNGANANAQENYFQTSLHLASDQGTLAVARVLLEHVADTDVQDVSGWTALHVASSGGQVEAARLLLDKGADVNVLEKDGWTALHLAVYNGHHRIVALLLNYGADPRAQNNEGDAPHDVASESVHAAEAAQVLLRHIGN